MTTHDSKTWRQESEVRPQTWLRRFCVLGLVILLAGASGCGQKTGSPHPKAGAACLASRYQTMNNPFFVDLNEGLKQVIEAHGDRLVTLDAQFNSLKQKNDISDLLQQQPAASSSTR